MTTTEDTKSTSPPTTEQTAESPSNDTTDEATDSRLVRGWRLYMLTLGIWIALFLSTLETTIVSTSLVAISDSLNGFERRNWVVTAYFLTYTGFLVIYAKLSSIFGRKTLYLVALVLFTVFSLVCGAVNSIVALIILRAFQGMGASGIYSMTLVIAPTLVPREEYGKYIGIVSSVFVLASVIGPVVGGAIATHTTWRWVFLLNGPGGLLAIVLLAIFLPASEVDGFPNFKQRISAKFSSRSLQRVDILGIASLLAGSVLLVFALESGGTQYTWHSAAIISTLTLSGLAWLLFVVWELHLGKVGTMQEPIFPMVLLKDRLICSMMATTFFIGFPFVAIIFAIPQRAQAVNGFSAIKAGWALLPLLLSSPFATAISGVLTSTYNIPPAYLIVFGTMTQFIGVGLTISVPFQPAGIPATQYGYEALMGVGFGLSLSTVLTLADLVASKKDVGVLMGAFTQVRVLGGTIALAICSALLSDHLKSQLLGVISPTEFQRISGTFSSIESLDSEQKMTVKRAFADGYELQMQVLTAFSGIAFLSSLFLWERTPRTVKSMSDNAKKGNAQQQVEKS